MKPTDERGAKWYLIYDILGWTGGIILLSVNIIAIVAPLGRYMSQTLAKLRPQIPSEEADDLWGSERSLLASEAALLTARPTKHNVAALVARFAATMHREDVWPEPESDNLDVLDILDLQPAYSI
ncbi:hypothetical protein FRC09_014511, partial [Ceratobasidium sp. 395]